MSIRKVALKLQVGKTYIDGRGKSVTIKKHSKPPHQQFGDWEFQDDLGLYFKADGTCPGMTNDRDLLRPLYSIGETYVDITGTLHKITGFNNANEYPLTSGVLAWKADGDFDINSQLDLQDYAPAVANCVARNEPNRGVMLGGDDVDACVQMIREIADDLAVPHIRADLWAQAPRLKFKAPDVLLGNRADVVLDDIPMPALEQVPPSTYRIGMYVEVFVHNEWHMAKIVHCGEQGNSHVHGVEIKTPLITTHDCCGKAQPNKGAYVFERDMRRINPPDGPTIRDVPMYHEKPAPEAPARLSDVDRALIWNAFESALSDESYVDWDEAMDTLIAQRRKLNAA